MNVYIAGPMRGYPNFNFPAFHAAAARLRAQGHTVFSPAERDEATYGATIFDSPMGQLADLERTGFSLRESLAADCQWICLKADAIYLLRGWQRSKGARAEQALGWALELHIWYEEELS